MDPETRRFADAYLLGSMYTYAASVLYPALALKRAGLPVAAPPLGEVPLAREGVGLGTHFSVRYPEPLLGGVPGPEQQQAHDFDRVSGEYGKLVAFFSVPIFEEAMALMRGWLDPGARVLDAGCGPGRELICMAKLVPRGEVVGIDLAAGMLSEAHRAARAEGVSNAAFIQADASALPAEFSGQFDLVYSCLAHHHYADPAAVTRSVAGCLRAGGIYCVVDPGPAWYNKIAEPLARWADSGFAGYHTPEQFRGLFTGAGFARTSWFELLPGFGLAVGQKG